MIVGHFNTPQSPINRSSKQKNQQRNLTLKDTIGQLNLTGIYKVFNPAATQYAFSSAARETFSKVDILGHKAILANLTNLK
jgi:hypothetical protein